ncbi:MAG: subtype B tannase [Veillonella sp.]|nr:subtype B tannase [Veillonella sp.]
MKSSKKRQVTAAFFAAAALGGVAHAAPVLNMNDLVGSKTTSESTTETINNVATPVVRPMDTQPMVPRVRPVPVPDTAKALEEQYRAVSQPQYVVNKQTNTMMEPTLAMHSLINVQRKTEPVTVQKQVDGKQQMQTTQVQRTPIIVQEQSTTPLVVANTTTTKSVIAKRTLTIRDIQRAERERLAKLAEEQAAQQEAMQQQSSEQAQAVRQMAAERAAEAQRQAALLAQQQEAQRQAELLAQQQEAQRQTAIKAEQERIAAQQAEAQRQAAIKAEQDRIAAEQAEAQRQAAIKAEQDRIAAEQAEAQRQAAIKAEQDRIAAEQAEAQRQAAIKAEQERIAAEQAEAQRQAAIKAEQERIAAEQAEAQRQAAIKAEQERIAAEQAEAQRQAAIKAEQERIAAEQAKAEQEAKAKAQAEVEAQRQAAIKAEQERIAAEQAKAEQEAKAKAEQEAKAKADAEAKARAEAKQAQEPKLPESYVNERNQASTKGSTTTGEKNILSQPIDPPLQADTSAKITLTFDINNYESMTGTVDNKEIKYRAFEYIPYVSNPIDIDQQYINIYIPEEYFNNGTVNGYNTQTAPIFMPNNVGGYMPSQPMAPKVENNKPNSALYALSRGYVVASPATRGRTNKASDGNFIGKAPAVIVDLQAATAYLHANDATMPGNAKRIITNGTSAGGAVSLLQGATGNTSDYQPYLQALGAATASTDVYASSAYAPITNLDAADMAYEWSYNGITSFNKVSMGQGELPQANVGGAPAPMQRSVQRVNLTNNDVAYSDLLKSHFPDYVNNLQLRDRTGVILKLDKKGNGTFKQYVKSFIIDAANKAKSNGADLSRYSFLLLDKNTGLVKDIDWDAYNSFTSRSKVPGAFDSRSNDSGENSLFGTSTSDTNHFTITAALHDTTPNNDVYVENAKIVTMMNPMNYLGSPSATNAKYYRIRYGTSDSNTSVAIPLIVGTRAQNLGYSVDMATPFGVDHSGDYDLQDLFNWMDSIVKNGR